jgi:hypothetical protein
MSEKLACAGDSCLCYVNGRTAVKADGRYYCSEHCSQGRGCGHMGCSCGHDPVGVPVMKTSRARMWAFADELTALASLRQSRT